MSGDSDLSQNVVDFGLIGLLFFNYSEIILTFFIMLAMFVLEDLSVFIVTKEDGVIGLGNRFFYLEV